MKKIKLKKNKKEKSNKWLSRHLNDIYYQEAKKKGIVHDQHLNFCK